MNSCAWPRSLPSARTMPVTADACCRAACLVAQWQRVCFQGCEEAGRLEEKCVVFIFLCRPNYVERRCPGHSPHQQQMSLLAEESVSPTLPLTFPGEARGNIIKSSMTPFYIENALELELWIQMALKESTREGLQVLPDGGEPGKQRLPLRDST